MKETDLAWAAGFLDGEGSFYIGWVNRPNAPGSFQIAITANQVRSAPLLKLQKMFGGAIYLQRKNPPVSMWRVTGRPRIVKILPLIIPYMVVKKKEAELLLKYCLRPECNRGPGKSISEREREIRYSYIKKMKSLR